MRVLFEHFAVNALAITIVVMAFALVQIEQSFDDSVFLSNVLIG